MVRFVIALAICFLGAFNFGAGDGAELQRNRKEGAAVTSKIEAIASQMNLRGEGYHEQCKSPLFL